MAASPAVEEEAAVAAHGNPLRLVNARSVREGILRLRPSGSAQDDRRGARDDKGIRLTI